MEKNLKELQGSSIIRSELLEGFPMEKVTLTLEELTQKKKKISDKILSLNNSLYGMQVLKLDTIKDLHRKITALQYNFLLVKLRIAILNVGIPDRGYNGIYASIFQSSDLKLIGMTLTNLLNKIKLEPNNMSAQEKIDALEYLNTHINTGKVLQNEHRETQLKYNKVIKVEMELYKIEKE